MDIAPSTTLFETLYADVLDFLTTTPTPEQIIEFQPSESLKQRMSELLELNRHDRLGTQERQELDEFLRLNHFMSMLKLHARQKLAGQ